MRKRCPAQLFAIVTVLVLTSFTTTGQAQAPSSGASRQFQTPWGDPDLQGIWTNVTITPLQRPLELGDKQVLTEEEAAALEQATAARRVDGPPRDGDPGTYNQHWFDRGNRVIGTRQTSLIVDPPNGRIPWTAEAELANATRNPGRGSDYWDSYTDLDTGERCMTDGLPFVPYAYNNNYQIFQSPGYVAILHEMFRERRIIPLAGRPHTGEDIGQWFGDSRGHWEGDTLVVETINFNDKTSYRWAAFWRVPRPTLHLVERFTRIDTMTINYQFTVIDPTMFTQPWTAVSPWSGDQEGMGATVGRLFEYACHEGNYAMDNVLAGAREKEKAGGNTNTR